METRGVRLLADKAVVLPQPPSNASHHSANDEATQEQQLGSRFPVSSGDTERKGPPDLWFRLLG